MLTPSTAVNELLQVVPLLIEYWTMAPFSMPERVSAPLLVIWSELELPLSTVSATPGAAGAMVSRVKLKLVALDTLPAKSVWRTRTVFGPSTAAKELLQVLPPSSEYSTRAPASMPERVSPPLLVIWSVAELPLSSVSATLGATGGIVSSVKLTLVTPETLPATSV